MVVFVVECVVGLIEYLLLLDLVDVLVFVEFGLGNGLVVLLSVLVVLMLLVAVVLFVVSVSLNLLVASFVLVALVVLVELMVSVFVVLEVSVFGVMFILGNGFVIVNVNLLMWMLTNIILLLGEKQVLVNLFWLMVLCAKS